MAHLGSEVVGQLGNRKRVSTANLASLMLLVEEDGKTILLTGDRHGDDILKGLTFHNKLNDVEGIHVNVLKVQHHGSEHNADAEFAKRVTADHYVFCGNGAHENPDLEIVEVFVQSRLGDSAKRSRNPEVEKPFKFWFNSSSAMNGKYAKHMKKLEKKMRTYRRNNEDKLDVHFLGDPQVSFEIE